MEINHNIIPNDLSQLFRHPSEHRDIQKAADFVSEFLYALTTKSGENSNATIEMTLAFLSKCLKYSVITSEEPIVMALIYLQRLNEKRFLSQTPTYAATAACVMLATKQLEDCPFNNESFSRLSQLGLADLNALELAILLALDWKVTVSNEEYSAARSSIFP
jgi:hypothetical protein